MLLLLQQLIDDPPERQETSIDHTSLPRTSLLRSTASDVLGSCQVDQIEFPNFEQVFSSDFGRLLDVNHDREDRVRSTANTTGEQMVEERRSATDLDCSLHFVAPICLLSLPRLSTLIPSSAFLINVSSSP